jgi:glycosyltransferase involved in cell wall biosynthesis
MDQGATALVSSPDAGSAPQSRSVLAVIAPHVDAAFYLSRNEDVRTAGMAAAEHYWRTGWREGRDPSAWFSTEYYLRTNPDVRTAGLNPLWHYLARGRAEGRAPRLPGGPWRAELEALTPPEERDAPRTVPTDARELTPDVLAGLLDAACLGACGLVVAFSHDRYTDVAGGVQLLVADEQRKFNGDRAAYLHLSPVEARLALGPLPAGDGELGVILDGTWCGVVRLPALLASLAELPAGLPRLLVVHALHGHRPESVAQVAHALRPAQAFFYAHDYGAVCGSLRLLRNDIAHCGAPPPESLACRICIHGPGRAAHAARVRSLFDAVPMHLLAPSAVAAQTWQRANHLPVASVRVHPHARLEDSLRPEAPGPADDGPVRLAFVGSARYDKGWGTFLELLGQLLLRAPDRYACYHVASPHELGRHDGLIPVAATAGPRAPFATLRALARHRIELVVALSPWPETFGYVPHEAIAAGAHVLALEGSGAIAALVRATGRGEVLPDRDALAACLLDGRAAAGALARRAAGRRPMRLRHVGSAATLPAQGAEVPPLTAEPDLHILLERTRIAPQRDGDAWTFALPPNSDPSRSIRLRSRSVFPLWEPDMAHDARRLGVAVTALELDGAPLAPDDPAHLDGWYAPEPHWRWTDGDALLRVGRATTLTVRLANVLRYWQSPLLARAAP